MIRDIDYINKVTDRDRVARLKLLRGYWIANVETLKSEERSILAGYIYQTRKEVDLQCSVHSAITT